MKWLVFTLLFVFSCAFSQTNCELCVEQGGFYCGDDESNWTQYSPNGCVPNGLNNLFYLNDGWLDCVDGSDEDEAVPTVMTDCTPYVEPCDTVYVVDTVYIDIINWFPEYVDCETMLPCNSDIGEILDKSIGDGRLYNLQGQPIKKPEGIYIENGIIKYKI
jgi:hypothetical protein